MLRSLTIGNVALIDRAEINFSEGMNILSGETGAGKSVILECIDFALGGKADRGMIRYGQSECFVRAEFSNAQAVLPLLEEFDIEADDTLIVSRKFTTDGKSTLKVNGCSVTVAMLRRITSMLVDVHGQSEHFYLLKESNQLALLDKIAGKALEEQKTLLKTRLNERKELLHSMKSLGGDDNERARRLDILNYQIDEIERSAPKINEDDELKSQLNLFYHSEKILDGLNDAARDLSQEQMNACDLVSRARKAVASLLKYDEKYSAIEERLSNAAEELSDISGEIEGYLDELNFDEREQERCENRLDELNSLKKKYGGSVEEVLNYLSRAKDEKETLENANEKREEILSNLEKNKACVYEICQEITKIRKNTAVMFEKNVVNELKTLNISSANFQIKFNDYSKNDVDKATQSGMDQIQFLFSANAGQPLKELSKIISGGEMSRFMLAIKSQYSGAIGTCVFDEIDAGVGGKTAWAIAEKFQKIAKHTQVIAVSHLAQIASFADRQFVIEKKEKNGETYSQITQLEEGKRREEIARMLTGDNSELSLTHADDLLNRARESKQNI